MELSILSVKKSLKAPMCTVEDFAFRTDQYTKLKVAFRTICQFPYIFTFFIALPTSQANHARK